MPAEYHVHNLGCKVNRVESDVIKATIDAAGGSFVDKDEARVVIINTCTVTGEAETKTRKAIRQALGARQSPWVIATGCATALDSGALAKLGDRVIVKPDRVAAKDAALELLGLCQPDNDKPRRNGQDYPRRSGQDYPRRSGLGFPTRMGIKIQDGCDNACSYCIVHIVRGSASSIAADSIVSQLRLAEEQGLREIVLTGINIGAYRDGSRDLSALLELLLRHSSKLRIRLSSLEPQHLTTPLLKTIAASDGRICSHLHLPLQSGCDKTLSEMARSYDSAGFARRVSQARALMPQVSITTDLIVGFPGESGEDFETSLDFCEQIGFSRIHVFRYSKRPKTPAAVMASQVSPEEKARRSVRARALAERMLQADLKKRVGSTEKVLVESKGHGTSESYHGVALPASYQIGDLLPMRFVGVRDNLFTVQ